MFKLEIEDKKILVTLELGSMSIMITKTDKLTDSVFRREHSASITLFICWLVCWSLCLSVCPHDKILAYIKIWLQRNCFAPGPSRLFWVVTKPQARSNCDVTSFRSEMGMDGTTDGRTNQQTNIVSYRGASSRLKMEQLKIDAAKLLVNEVKQNW
jgi:hypothetical protein